MNDDKKIKFDSDEEKQLFKCIGYYHAYKGYRFYGDSQTEFQFDNIAQLLAIYKFDSECKTLLYPKLMFIETALKNIVLDVVLINVSDTDFDTVYREALINYKNINDTNIRKKAMIKRMRLKNNINSILINEYRHDGNKIFNHYISKDKYVPIWGIFESITLGTFGNFISCLDDNIREEISKTLGIEKKYDPDYLSVQKMIYIIKELRNATAHNSPIFDIRFSNAKVSKAIKTMLKNEFNIRDIYFNNITDYMVLIAYLLVKIGIDNSEILDFIYSYEKNAATLDKTIKKEYYHKIVRNDLNQIIEKLKIYLENDK